MTKTSKTQKEIDRIYQQKAKQSFNSRFDLLLYSRIRNGISNEITNQELEDFLIKNHSEILDEYLNFYWQEELDFEIEGKTIKQIYSNMKEFKDNNKPLISDLQKQYIDNIFPRKVFPKQEFEAMFTEDIECEYCHMTENKVSNLIGKGQIHKKHITRGWSLEIDRKIPNHEYTKENCVWCCYWCNNAKTDEFSHPEFIIIGETLEKIWNGRLKSK